MKNLVYLSLLLVLVPSSITFAQDSKVSAGAVKFENGDYKLALDNLDKALVNPSALKHKNVPKAYYFRAQARIKYMGELAKQAQGGYALTSEEQSIVQTAVPKSWLDYKKALAEDDGKWKSKIQVKMVSIGKMALSYGSNLYNQAFSEKNNSSSKQLYYTEAKKYFTIAAESAPSDYLAYDLLGQVQLSLNDTIQALSNFEKSVDLFSKNLPKKPNQFIAYSYYRIAIIEYYSNEDVDKALGIITNGTKVLNREYERYLKIKDSYTDSEAKQFDQGYISALENLKRFELNVYLNEPDKLDDALKKFEQATKDEPKNYSVHVAFAQLLEKTNNFLTAITIYEKAIQIDPKKQHAWFNLGALYMNLGSESLKKANDQEDFKRGDIYRNEGDAMYKKAFPNLEKANELVSCDSRTLSALKQIAITLSAEDPEMQNVYMKYKAEQKKCGL